MGRILAIDYGLKRCGLAVTDPLKIIAHALDTIDTKGLMPFLTQYFQQEEVERVIIGLPMNLQNQATHGTPLVQQFLQNFKKQFPSLPVETHDERFTSKMAFKTMLTVGLSKKDRRDKSTVDKISATIILQSYMESQSLKPGII